MPEFILDTSGTVEPPASAFGKWPWTALDRDPDAFSWRDLDDFDRGYIEALFFTENEPSLSRHDDAFCYAYPGPDDDAPDDDNKAEAETDYFARVREGQIKEIPSDYGYSDLSSEALLTILTDCREFKARAVHIQPLMGEGGYPDEAQAGRDFWYTRNRHGCGFWDGDWPEPHATELDEIAKGFGEVNVQLDDDAKVQLF